MANLPWTTIEQGITSGIGYAWWASFRCQLEWEKVWRWHAEPRKPIPVAPAVDFKSEMVIALFAAGRHCRGSVEITELQEGAHYIYVLYKEHKLHEPALSQAQLRPFHIVRAPDRLKSLRFERIA